jgi:plasmid maintenance system antidote protein VapI
MIRSEGEYQVALKRLREDEQADGERRAAISAQGFTPEQVEELMGPWLCFRAGWAEEIQWYEAARRGDLPIVRHLQGLGRLLIALRIYQGLTQRQLAERLGVSEAAVSRDEHNEYHGITVERAQRILDALGAKPMLTAEVVSAAPLSRSMADTEERTQREPEPAAAQ